MGEKKASRRASLSAEGRLVRTQIQFTKTQSSRLKTLASSRGLSVADLVRRAVDTLLRSGVSIDIEEKRRRAVAAAGRFRSGVSDLSVNHDRYLEDSFSGKKAD